MPPALRVWREDAQNPTRPERMAGDGEERDRLEDVLDDAAGRDDIERVGGQRRGLDRALGDVEAVRAGEGRGFRVRRGTLHPPAQGSHASSGVTAPPSDIQEGARR